MSLPRTPLDGGVTTGVRASDHGSGVAGQRDGPDGGSPRAGSRTRSLVGWLTRLAIGCGILFFLFSFIPFSEVVRTLGSAELGWVMLSLVVLILERWVAALRTTMLSDHVRMDLTVVRNLEISLSATFYGMALPGELAGGAVRWYKMSRPSGMRAEAAAVLTFDRLIATAVLLLTGVGFWLLESPPLSNPALEVSFLVLLVGVLLGIGALLSGTAATLFLAPLAGLAHRFRLRFVYEALEKVLDSIQSFSTMAPGTAAALLAVTVVRQLLAVAIMFLMAAALGLDIGFVTLGWINAFMNVAMLLPVSVSGLGVREGTLVFALAPYGVVGSAAVALSFLLLLTHVLTAVAGGLVELRGVFGASRRAGSSPS